jgi:N-acetylglutamate synthase-like GNAT family acetyltransferase
MKAEILIRPATASDWRAVKSLLEENELPIEGARENLVNYVLATENAQVIGCAGTEVYGDLALVRSVSVAPLVKSLGIGTMLVSRIIDESRQRKRSAIYLLTTTAPEYFTRFGFRNLPIGDAPQALRASAEFNGACPASATLMVLVLAT